MSDFFKNLLEIISMIKLQIDKLKPIVHRKNKLSNSVIVISILLLLINLLIVSIIS